MIDNMALNGHLLLLCICIYIYIHIVDRNGFITYYTKSTDGMLEIDALQKKSTESTKLLDLRSLALALVIEYIKFHTLPLREKGLES